jgi:hypothetical protein
MNKGTIFGIAELADIAALTAAGSGVETPERRLFS